jgi:hypothetical protein
VLLQDEFSDSLITALRSEQTFPQALEGLMRVLSALLESKEFVAALQLETELYQGFVKSASADHFDKIYKTISLAYQVIPDETSLTERSKTRPISAGRGGIAFIIHTSKFLAHVVTLYWLLRDRHEKLLANDTDSVDPVTVLVLSPPDFNFTFAMTACGVRLQHAGQCNLAEGLDWALQTVRAEKFSSVVWMCTPLGLPYFSSHYANTIWWSVKHHPQIDQVKLRISGRHDGQSKYQRGAHTWHGFTSPVKYANQALCKKPFATKKNLFGAFCREELIDDEVYWRWVAVCLKAVPNAGFVYTGKQPIHEKWIEDLGIDDKRVLYLGWLSNPEQSLQDVRVLLDPRISGHGLLAREAMYAGVPLMFCATAEAQDTVVHRNIRIARKSPQDASLQLSSSFTTDQQLTEVFTRLMTEENFNDLACEELRTIFEPEANDWVEFRELINLENHT